MSTNHVRPIALGNIVVLALASALLAGCPDEKKVDDPASKNSPAPSASTAPSAAPGNTGSGW